MSYENHADFAHLNRFRIREALLRLAKAEVERKSATRSRDEQYKWLLERIDPRSSFEREFVNFLYNEGYILPDWAQKAIPEVGVVADFFYNPNVVIFCDGPIHDTPWQRERDCEQREELRLRGYRVIVVRYNEPLALQVKKYPEVFGKGKS